MLDDMFPLMELMLTFSLMKRALRTWPSSEKICKPLLGPNLSKRGFLIIFKYLKCLRIPVCLVQTAVFKAVRQHQDAYLCI